MVGGLARNGVFNYVPDGVLVYIALYGISVLQEARPRRRIVLCSTYLEFGNIKNSFVIIYIYSIDLPR